jgi:hypothetical protein
MDTVLGLLGFAIFIPCVIGLAASVTWTVVKIFPSSEDKAKQAES